MPYSSPSVNIISTNFFGQAIVEAIINADCATIQSVININTILNDSQSTVDKIGQCLADSHINNLLSADFTFIIAKNDEILPIFSNIYSTVGFKPYSTVVYFSNTKPLSFPPIESELNFYIVGVHFMEHICSIDNAITSFKNTFCIIEGDRQACNSIAKFITDIGGNILQIRKEDFPTYYIAFLFATNFHKILFSATSQLYESCGIDKPTAIKLAIDFAKKSLNCINLEKKYDYDDIDIDSIIRNNSCIENKDIHAIYVALSRFAITLSKHNEVVKEQLRSIIKIENYYEVF